MKKLIAAAAIGLCSLCGMTAGLAQYPSRTVTLLVPTTPGTAQDVLARQFAPVLAQKFGQAFIVENRPGASGNIGTAVVTKAAPDGHTLLVTASTLASTPPFYKDLPYDPATDLAPVASFAKAAMALAVHPSFPATSVQQFISQVKLKPGAYNYSSPGNGSAHHLMMELLKLQAGINIVHIPFKGTGDAVAGLIGGTVNASMISLVSAIPQVKNGRLRVLASTGDRRSVLASEISTFREANLAEMDIEPWLAVFAPAGTPRDIITRLNGEFNSIMQLAQFKEVLSKYGMSAFSGTPEELGTLLKEELVRWQRVVKQAGIKAD